MKTSAFFLLIFCLPALADNSFFSSAYLQIKNRKFCGTTSPQDLQAAGFTCYKRQPVSEFQLEAWKIYEWNAMDKSAQSQIQKNNCLNERMAAIQSDPTVLSEWIADLRTVWLGIRKAELIAEKCDTKFWNRLHKSDLKEMGPQKAYERAVKRSPSYEQLDTEWIEKCSDLEAVEAMRSAREIFSFSLPVINDPRLLDAFEKHRDMLIESSSGRRLTDQDIISHDLRTLDFVDTKVSAAFLTDLKKTFATIAADRTDISNELIEGRKAKNPEIDGDLKEFIYQDGTLTSTLLELGQISKDGTSIESSGGTGMNPGAYCLLSKYESNLETTLVDIGGFVATFGVGWVKLLQGLGKLEKGARFFKKLGKALNSGMTTSGLYDIRKIPISCSKAGLTEKLTEAGHNKARSQADVKSSNKASSLPGHIGYGKFSAQIDPQKTPSCKKIENENLGVNLEAEMNCTRDIMFAFMEIAFGARQLKSKPNK